MLKSVCKYCREVPDKTGNYRVCDLALFENYMVNDYLYEAICCGGYIKCHRFIERGRVKWGSGDEEIIV